MSTYLPLNHWTHLAGVIEQIGNDVSIKCFINGILAGSTLLANTDITNTLNNAPVYIGKTGDCPDYYQGMMDELRICNTARTQTMIQSQMHCELEGTEPGLVALYHFNQDIAGVDNTGVTMMEDATANNNNGTLSNFALTGPTSNWMAPGAEFTGECIDEDMDGYTIETDCDDNNPNLNPGATELYNGIDDDCDEDIDEDCPTCTDGIMNGDELGIDCGGAECDPCSPPDTVCGVITVYVDPYAPVYDGPGNNNIWWIAAEDLDAGSTSDAPSPSLNVRRHLSNITFDWTMNSACIDATPNGGALSNADMGIVYRTCLPVRNADFNVNRIYQLQISDLFGTDACYGTVKVKTATPSLSAPSIHYVIPAAEKEMIVAYFMHHVDQDLDPDVLSYTGFSDFIVYPNPGTDLLQMSWDALADEQINVLITDMAGRVVFSNDYDALQGQNTVMIDMSSHPSGMFLVYVKSGTMQELRKWMKL